MKCSKCGAEFEGKFCPECGSSAETVQTASQQPAVFGQEGTPVTAKTKKKKPFYKKWWFILIVIIALIILLANLFGGDNKEKKKEKEYEDFDWSSFSLSDKLPEPKSSKGEYVFDNSDSLSLTVAKTSKTDYNEYVSECEKDYGFSVDKSKSDSMFRAKNSENYSLSVIYYSTNKEMSISLRLIKEGDDSEESNESSTSSETKSNESKSDDSSTGIRTNFKNAMDSYEASMDEYVAFMKKYNANPSDAQLLLEYSKYLQKYTKCCEDFEKWDDEQLNDAELAYYLEVQTRVNNKLLEVAQ